LVLTLNRVSVFTEFVVPKEVFEEESTMRVTTKGRFAVTAMIDLALRELVMQEFSLPVALAAISARQEISLSYLEQLFGKLKRHKLVDSTRGPGGGYSLGRKPEHITVADIMVAVDEHEDAKAHASKEASCRGNQESRCLTHELWAGLNAKMIEYLDSINLLHLVNDQLAQGISVDTHDVMHHSTAASRTVTMFQPVQTNAPNSIFSLGCSFSK
jgi:Rrf2 family transcriptional regulator, iron-sulfur cluster assembly transcription factor